VERRIQHSALMACERLADWFASIGIPQPCRPVQRRSDDALAVGAKRNAQHSLRVSYEGLADWLAGLDVPQPPRLVSRRGDDVLAVGAEHRAEYKALMALENKSLAQIAPSCIELQFRLRDICSSDSGGFIGKRLQREQGRSPEISRGAMLARKVG